MNARTYRIETTLDELAPGTTGRVMTVSGDDAISRRLGDLGFWPGTDVVVVRRAPFGDPIEYFLRGYRLALRRGEARRVVVSNAP
jgi:Fe2+ transport system protein FeoA